MQENETTTGLDLPPKKTINLALGGGGLRGLVHIGVLKALSEERYQVGSVVGTSIGAIIGAIFAYNRAVTFSTESPLDSQRKSVEALETICVNANFARFLDFNFPFIWRGLFRGQKIERWLQYHLRSTDHNRTDGLRFSELPFDLTIAATNANTGEPVIFNQEEDPAVHIDEAVRCSMSIQQVFKECQIAYRGNSVTCWDGGTTGNCRFDIAHKRNPDRITIASSLTYRGEPRFYHGWWRPIGVMDQTIAIMMRQMEQLLVENMVHDGTIHIVRPNFGNVKTLDFGLSTQERKGLIENGRQATLHVLNKLEGR